MRYMLAKEQMLHAFLILSCALMLARLAGFSAFTMLLLALVVTIVVGVVALIVYRSRPCNGEVWRNFLLLQALFLLGFASWFWADWRINEVLDGRLPIAWEKQDMQVTGQILGVPRYRTGSVAFDFLPQKVHAELPGDWHFNGPIRLQIYEDDWRVNAGETWRFSVRLTRPRGFQNTGQWFNYERHLLSSRYNARGYVRYPATAERLGLASQGGVTALRAQVVELLAQHSFAYAGLLGALSVGIKDAIDDEQWRVMRATGIPHLMAISGLHIGLLASALLGLVIVIWRCIGAPLWLTPIRTYGLVIALLGAGGYALMAGLALPTQRATLVLLFAVLGVLWHRQAGLLRVLLLAFTALLWFDPLQVYKPGFWLSFCAMATIYWYLTKRWRQPQAGSLKLRCQAYLWQWMRLQLLLTAVMLPLVLWFFQQASMVSPLANLIAIPVVGFVVVPICVVAILCCIINLPTLATFLFGLADWVLQMLWLPLQWLAELPFASVTPLPRPDYLWVLLLLGLLLMMWRIPARWSGALLLLPWLFWQKPLLEGGEFRYTMLDIGHGLASVIETRHHAVLFDAGPTFRSGLNTGELVVLPYLRHQGISKLDTAVISHGDNDHVGGFAVIDEVLPIDVLLSGDVVKLPAAKQCHGGLRWAYDDVVFSILAPAEGASQRGNDGSCVLHVANATGSILLTGDIEIAGEAALLAVDNLPKVEVLQVPHQGSRTSSTAALLARFSPQLAMVSTGYKNQFAHPHEDVLLRYTAADITMLNTAYCGAISVEFRRDGMALQVQRHAEQPWWMAVNEGRCKWRGELN